MSEERNVDMNKKKADKCANIVVGVLLICPVALLIFTGVSIL